jgi:hypothetical protein
MALEFHNDNYEEWRKKRITLLTEIVGGEEWYAGKYILEVGCGLGHVGKYLQTLGAFVTFTEGRKEQVDTMLEEKHNIHLIDHDKPWAFDHHFDLIIHWGLLYHLANWQQDLKCALAHSNLICLETLVIDSYDPTIEIKMEEDKFRIDQSLNGKGTRPSVARLEQFFRNQNCAYTRYDDESLNQAFHAYDWLEGKRPYHDRPFDGLRRFWMIYGPSA